MVGRSGDSTGVERAPGVEASARKINALVRMSGGVASDKRYVLKVLDDHLIPDEIAKAERGEVFTPPDLVREMLFGLSRKALKKGEMRVWGIDEYANFIEADDEDRVGGLPTAIWRNPELKWLDPANGIGNFPIIAFYRLDYELKSVQGYENDDYRRKHIIENMLYMMELDKENVSTCSTLFRKIHPDARSNVCCCDSLSMTDEKLQNIFGINRFDIVMGNPPFQIPKIVGLKGGYGGRTLWDKFVKYAIEVLRNKESKLAFLHPPGWRKPESELWKLMACDNSIEFLRIFPKSQTLFDISQRFDYYILSPVATSKAPIIIVDENSHMHTLSIHGWAFVPNAQFEKIKNILTTRGSGIPIIYSRSKYGTDKRQVSGIPIIYNSSKYDTRKPYVNQTKTDVYKYPIIHEMNLKGHGFKWTDKPDYDDTSSQKHFGTKKVILSFNEYPYPYNDYKGEYGMSQIAYGIPIGTKEEGDRIVEAIESKEFREIIKATKWGAFQTDYRMFRYIRPDFWKQFVIET